ncbi:MAG TPA: protein kinase [Thermoanaerobaculia bacterium]
MPLEPGTRLGVFEILGPLGAGGMGEVYRARDTKLGREVAIKILPEAFSRDPMRVARFEREARMLASVNHPAIAAIYGAEESGAQRYIVMELVPGDTLSSRMAQGSLPIEESLVFAHQIAEALEAAHEKGVIHRDLKPANIKVTPAGRIKVLDLGLAKMMEEPSGEHDLSNSPTLTEREQTRPGVILGTAEFMSPEQARGKPVDKRTDIWAFGCILFEMLSGTRTFAGETVSDVLAAILKNEPAWEQLPAQTPPRIRELLARCLQKDAAKRLRDIGDARMEIEKTLEGDGGGSALPSPTPAPGGGRRVAAVLILLILAAAGLWWMRSRPKPLTEPTSQSLVVLPVKVLSGETGGQLVGDGLADMLSAKLYQVPGIQVVTPTAVIAAAAKQTDRFEAARSVGGKLVFDSSLIQSGDRLRIIYSVWNVQTRAQVDGDTVDGSASDIFAVQDKLVDRVASGLKLPKPSKKTPTPSGLETASEQERYLEALGLLQRYDRRDQVEKAIAILEPLRKERPNSPLVNAALGRAYLAMYDFAEERPFADKALAFAEEAHRLDPSLADVDITLGDTLLVTGKAKEAGDAFRRALATQPGRYEAVVGLGRALAGAGEDRAAEATLQKAIALQPAVFAAYNRLGAFYFARGRFREAAASLRRATQLAPDSYRAHSGLGGVYTMQCDFSAALAEYRKALDLKLDDADTASNLGLTQLWMGLYSDAVNSLEKATRAAPDNFQLWGNLGDAYRGAKAPREKSDEAYARSISLARTELELNPKDAAAHSFIATGLARTGRRSEASAEMQKALALDANNPNVLSDAAIVSALSGRNTEAIEFLKRAIASGYCPAIIARQPEFESLRSDSRYQALIAARRAA